MKNLLLKPCAENMAEENQVLNAYMHTTCTASMGVLATLSKREQLLYCARWKVCHIGFVGQVPTGTGFEDVAPSCELVHILLIG